MRAFVVLIHQGGFQNGPFPLGYQDSDRCDNFSGDIVPIVNGLSSQVDVVISAHTHQPYICHINGKLVTSASSFGRLITDIDLRIDQQTKDIVSATAHNVIVTRDVAKDAAETAIINKYDALSGPIANRVVGSQSADMTKTNNAAGESALGDVIADAQLASTSPTDFGGAVVAFMNPGGIRADLPCSQPCTAASPAPVTYNQLFTVQPFNNVMTVKTMTGDMIYRLLEQQFTGANGILQVSNGFAYTWSPTTTPHVIDGSVKIDGVAVDKTATYRVAMNNFLASGGDGFTVFNEGTDPLGGEIDLDALVNYFMHNSPVGPGAAEPHHAGPVDRRQCEVTSEAGCKPGLAAAFGGLRGEQLVDVVDDVLGLHACVVDDAALARAVDEHRVGGVVDELGVARHRRDVVGLPDLGELVPRADQVVELGQEVMRLRVLVDRLRRVALGIDADGEHAHVVALRAEHLQGLVQVLRDERADVRAVGVEEGEENELPALVGHAHLLARLVGEGEVWCRLRRVELAAGEAAAAARDRD